MVAVAAIGTRCRRGGREQDRACAGVLAGGATPPKDLRGSG